MHRMVLALGCLLILGCGDSGPPKAEQYPVSGKVTVGGSALTDCTVSFVSSDPAKSDVGFSGVLDSSGGYSLGDQADGKSGAFPGKYKVVLSPSPEAAKKAMMAQSGPDYTGGSLPFPEEYQSAETSPKEVEVKAESNQIDIVIE